MKRDEDAALFTAIYDDARRLVRMAESVAITTLERVKPNVDAPKQPNKKPEKDGTCIRCATPIPFNTERPYCAEDYKAWAKWSNVDYEDERCLGCRDEIVATMRKPLCKSCYRARG